jgi:general secretion pathway protein G
MAVLVIASLLVSLAVPTYVSFIERAKVSAAVGDISEISLAIEQFRLRNDDRLPLTLDELGIGVPLDPWGREYRFLNIFDGGAGILGDVRKDGRLNPLNTDFDLFSTGKDGDTTGPLNARASRDDVVRANNGAFIGLGENY